MSNRKKQQCVDAIISGLNNEPKLDKASVWAATNIALCKYWGKRDLDLNLPLTDSLSVMLPEYGVEAQINISKQSRIIINGKDLDLNITPAKQIDDYMNLFPLKNLQWELKLDFNIPVAAGYASSACCYAALAKVVDKLFGWKLGSRALSILARIGSGSASRSIETGFSQWKRGNDDSGTDSFAEQLKGSWPELAIALYTVSKEKKPTSSREGMLRTTETSKLYSAWPQQVANDMKTLRRSITEKNFDLLGSCAENNALAMHATMISAWPPLNYSLPETIKMQQQIWEWRNEGRQIYFTQDAGPNLKIIVQKKDIPWLQEKIPNLVVSYPFSGDNNV